MPPKSVLQTMQEEDGDKTSRGVENPPANPDNDVMQGHPANPPADPPEDGPEDQPASDEGELVEHTINGIRYMLPPDVVDNLKAEAASRQNAPNATDLPVQQDDPAPQGVEEDDDFESFYVDPKKYLGEFRDRIIEEVRTDLTQQYTQQRSQDAFWTGFYSENKDLQPYEDVVKLVLNKNLDSLRDMQSGQASVQLAELTRGYILSLASQFGGKDPKPNKTQQLAGSSKDTPALKKEPSAASEDDEPTSLSDAIKLRSQKREKSNITGI